MRRFLAILVFATAAAAATAAGSGVVLVPHVDPPGTPRFHDHPLGFYRLPIFVNGQRALAGPRWDFLAGGSLFDGATALVLALLAPFVPRLPRPALRAIAEVARPRLARAQWRATGIHGPPRRALLA